MAGKEYGFATGWNLAGRFPHCSVFSPTTEDRALPYCDRSIDFVAANLGDEEAISEGRRVAEMLFVAFPKIVARSEPTKNRLDNNRRAPNSLNPVIEWRETLFAHETPTTSILIPVHNQWSVTAACLRSLFETLPKSFRGEVLVADDASSDETAEELSQWSAREPVLKILRNQTNQGFLRTCNLAAAASTGEILVLLNNDTVLLPNWLPPLWQVIAEHPDAGAVGGKLLFHDGSLQEAGGMVFRDGSAANFGRTDANPADLIYNFLRPVDYCSGALLATPRKVWEEIGGFDTRYEPAYYEDTDYCFAVRQIGRRVYYQPDSEIVHLEGLSSGTDISCGVKRYQALNQQKFLSKWADVLKRQPERPPHEDCASWRALVVSSAIENRVSR